MLPPFRTREGEVCVHCNSPLRHTHYSLWRQVVAPIVRMELASRSVDCTRFVAAYYALAEGGKFAAPVLHRPNGGTLVVGHLPAVLACGLRNGYEVSKEGLPDAIGASTVIAVSQDEH